MNVWNFVATDLSYTPVGEILNIQTRSVDPEPLNKIPSANIVVRDDNPLTDLLVSCECYVKIYRNGVLKLFGPVISTEESGDGQSNTVSVNIAGVAWILTKRQAGSAVGYAGEGQKFPVATDRAEIARQLIIQANLEHETGIDTTAAVSADSKTTYIGGPYRPVTDCITELSNISNGFDWKIIPLDGSLVANKIGQFQASPVFGQPQTAAVFEYGCGRRNVLTYRRARDRTTQMNVGYHFTSNGPTAPGYPVVSDYDLDSTNKWGLVEDVVQADIFDSTLRLQLVSEHIKVRKDPRTTIEFQPHIDDGTGRVPQYGVEYFVGDTIRARVGRSDGSIKFDAMLRVWGASFDIDTNGMERITLTLSDDGAS